MQGKFITFEGGEGAGKSTQIALLAEYLQKKGIAYVVTREPGGSKISEEIRNILLHSGKQKCTPECEALLIAAARMQHMHDIILPNLQQGKTVVCDRFIHSTYAYQGYGRGLDMTFLKTINAPATALAMPDCSFFLDIPPEIAFARKDSNIALDSIESAGIAFHTKVYNGFVELAKKEKMLIQIDGKKSKQEIHKQIVQILQTL